MIKLHNAAYNKFKIFNQDSDKKTDIVNTSKGTPHFHQSGNRLWCAHFLKAINPQEGQ